jgi:hypothetical protein
MKRSTQVSLVLMTAAGIGGAAYALTPRDSCRQSAPNAVAGNAPQDCRFSRGSSSGHGFFSSFGTGGSGTSAATPSGSTSTSSGRGGFGAIGHALSGGS